VRGSSYSLTKTAVSVLAMGLGGYYMYTSEAKTVGTEELSSADLPSAATLTPGGIVVSLLERDSKGPDRKDSSAELIGAISHICMMASVGETDNSKGDSVGFADKSLNAVAMWLCEQIESPIGGFLNFILYALVSKYPDAVDVKLIDRLLDIGSENFHLHAGPPPKSEGDAEAVDDGLAPTRRVLALLETLARVDKHADRMALNQKFWFLVGNSLDHFDREIQLDGWAVLMFLALNPNCKAMILEHKVMDKVASMITTGEIDGEVQMKIVFLMVNLINQFPLERRNLLTPQQKQLLTNSAFHFVSLFQQGKTPEKALALLNDLQLLLPNDPNILMASAKVHDAMRNYKKANECYYTILKSFPHVVDIRLALCKNLLAHGGPVGRREAKHLMSEGLRVSRGGGRNYPELYFLYAKTLEKEGDIYEAMVILEELNRIQPKNVKCLCNLARLQLGTKHLKKARSNLEYAVKLQPYDAKTLYWLGRAYYMLNMFPEAETTLRKAIHINPAVGSGLAHLQLGKICLHNGKYDQALEFLLQSNELSNSAEAHYDAGLVYLKLNQRDRALWEFEKTIEQWRFDAVKASLSFNAYLESHPREKAALEKIKQEMGDSIVLHMNFES